MENRPEHTTHTHTFDGVYDTIMRPMLGAASTSELLSAVLGALMNEAK